jgi:lipopolysaccharide transport system permease protein
MARNLYRHGNLVRQFAWRDVTARYKGSYLGILWSFINPLLMLAVYAFVFSFVFKSRWGVATGGSRLDFALTLFCGLTVFNIFSEPVSRAPSLIIANPSYVKKVVFPLETLPLSALLSSLVNAAISIVILLIASLAIRHTLSPTIPIFVIVLLPLCALTLGLAWFLASLGVFLRDLATPVTVTVQVLFFMSGIFFPLSAIPDRYRVFMRINPLTSILEDARRTLLWGRMPDWHWWLLTTIPALVIMQLGYMAFMRSRKAFGDVI